MESEPARVAKILSLAQERRDRRPKKVRVFKPSKSSVVAVSPAEDQSRGYARLPSGQIVGHPKLMCEVKRDARQSRLKRRANFRALRLDLQLSTNIGE